MATKRCKATTQSGSRCRNNAVDGSDYCAVHTPAARSTAAKKSGSATRCQALTASGSRCRNNALDGSDYCRVHKGTSAAKKSSTTKKSSSRDGGCCEATTASGARCRNNALDGSDFCAVHAKNKTVAKKSSSKATSTSSSRTTRCTATTQAGKRCRNDSLDGSKFCAVHDPNAGSDDVLGELGKLVESLQKGKSSKKKGYTAPNFSGPALLKLLFQLMAGGGKGSSLGALSGLMGAANLLGGASPSAQPEPADNGVSLDIPGMDAAPVSATRLSAASAEMGVMDQIGFLLNYLRDNRDAGADPVREQLADVLGRLDLGIRG